MVVVVVVPVFAVVVGMADELAVEILFVKAGVIKAASTSLPMLVVSSSLLLVISESPTTSFGGTSVSTRFSSIESVWSSIAELCVVVVVGS